MAVEEMVRRRCGGTGRAPAPHGGTAGGLPLRGREPETALLAERLAALAGGEGGVLAVEGPPGSGRTRLLAETRTRALAMGLSCRFGSTAFRGIPYGPLLEALGTGPAAPPAPDTAGRTLEEIRDGLARSAGQGPLLVCVDDVQWCDPVTLAALAELQDDLAGRPLLWVLATWPREPAAVRAGHRIVLGPMADPAVAALAADVLHAEPDDAVLRAARRAQGAPRLVIELLQGMREEGLVTVRDGIASADGAGEPVPRRLCALVRRRLDWLSPSARRSLQVASVLDRAFSAEELGELTGAPADEIAAVRDETVATGILCATGARLSFRHDLVRQAICADLPAAVRRGLLRRAVDVRPARGGTAVADAALAVAGDPASGDLAGAVARYALGRAAVHLEDPEGLRRCAADGARMMDAAAPEVRRAGAWLAALAADALGDTARAAELIPGAWAGADAPGLPPVVPPDPADHAVLARLALRAGLPGLASAAAGRAAASDPGSPLLRGVAAQARGIADDDPDLLLHAAKLLEGAGRPLVHASAAEDAGRALGAYGDPAARGLLETALGLYEESGAARDAARVRRRLRRLGVRAHRSGGGAEEGRWGLTAAEVKVALLVARGATNRQVAEQLFLSRHTVNTHLRHIFTKWDISSRVDLARRVLAHEAR
ncbi:AAA family ATPase [Actinomadura sp. GTD37]|uniref:AAA family ATPase n=1 Tax=Actinomadura sp. GTD37 TaxID=1778030 RepID=UPI0035C16B7B